MADETNIENVEGDVNQGGEAPAPASAENAPRGDDGGSQGEDAPAE